MSGLNYRIRYGTLAKLNPIRMQVSVNLPTLGRLNKYGISKQAHIDPRK